MGDHGSAEHRWYSLELEFLTLLVRLGGEPASFFLINDYLKEWNPILSTSLPCIPPFPSFVLQEVSTASKATGHKFIANSVAEAIKPIRDLHSRFSLYLDTLAYQLINPYGNSRFGFEQCIEDLARVLKKVIKHPKFPNIESMPLHLEDCRLDKERLEQLWNNRHVWPGRYSDSSWEVINNPTDSQFIERIDRFWDDWRSLIRAYPALLPFEEALIDRLRRYLYWNIILIFKGPASAPLGMALPAFPAIFTHITVDVRCYTTDNIKIEPDFLTQIRYAKKCAVDTWISRSRSWIPGRTIDNSETLGLWNSLLALDFRPACNAWNMVSGKLDLPIGDTSAGLAIGTGIIGMLSGQIPNATVWVTGPLTDGIPDRWERRRIARANDTEIITYDAKTGWSTRNNLENNILLEPIIPKFLAARAHGIARRVIVPKNTRSEIIDALKTVSISGNHNDDDYDRGSKAGRLGIHPVAVSLLSNAADAALPISYRKYRYVNAPELKWAFSLGFKKENGSNQIQLNKSQQLLSELVKHHCCFVKGPVNCGKSYSLAQAMTLSRLKLIQGEQGLGRSGPRVTFIRVPSKTPSSWATEIWYFILVHLAFPSTAIRDFMDKKSWKDKANCFLKAFRQYGPDILIMDGLQRFYDNDLKDPMPSSNSNSISGIFDEIACRMTESPIAGRDDVVRSIIGDLELIIERRDVLFSGPYPVIAISNESWDEEKAWKSVLDAFSPTGTNELKLLRHLSFFDADFGANGLYLLISDLFPEDELLRLTENLKGLHIVRQAGQYFLVDSNIALMMSGDDSGSLLREGQGKYHIHPLVRSIANQEYAKHIMDTAIPTPFGEWEARCKIAKAHLMLATDYFMPSLEKDITTIDSNVNYDIEPAIITKDSNILPLESLLPESLLFAEKHLDDAFQQIKNAMPGSEGYSLRMQIQAAQMYLMRYFREPTDAVADSIFTRMITARGQFASRKNWLACEILDSLIETSDAKAHSFWLVLKANIAEKLNPDELPETCRSNDWKLNQAEKALINALKHAEHVPQNERNYTLTYCKAHLAGFLLRYSRTLDIEGFRSVNEIINTFKNIATTSGNNLVAKEFLFDPIDPDSYCVVGDLLWDRGQQTEAKDIYLWGLNRMFQNRDKRGDKLIAHALGSVASISGKKDDVLSLGISLESWQEARNRILAPGSKYHPNHPKAKKDKSYKLTSYFLHCIEKVLDAP